MRTRRQPTISIFRWILLGLSAGVLVCGVGVAHAGSLETSPPAGIHAILLDSASGCDLFEGWQTLESDWSKYGTIPITITSGGHLCDGNFTLGDLEASGADTVILDGPAYDRQFSPEQIQALRTYLDEGHNLLGTDTVFQWKTRNDNGGLAPLFGLAEQSTWYIDGLGGKSPKYKLKEQDPDAQVLLRNVPNPYLSSLYGRGQKPADKKWVGSVLNGARYIARTRNQGNAISVYDAPAYRAIYISSQAAFMSTPDDLQFLYNAIIFPHAG